MGMDTLVNGPKQNGHRRGDLALVLGIVLGILEGYRAIAGQPALAADDGRIGRLEQAFQAFQVDITSRLAVLESKARK